jgi:hypothetical protein
MKNILILIALALCAVSASAQNVVQTIISGGTNRVAAATANTYTALIDTRKSEYVALMLSFKCTAASDSNTVFSISRGNDWSQGTNSMETTPAYIINVPANGTTTVSFATNINTLGWSHLILNTVSNGHASAIVSNLTVTAAQKILK